MALLNNEVEQGTGKPVAQMGRLMVVGTPIGNLGDLSPRVAEAFCAADVVCCEDTRVTAKLLAHVGATPELMRADEHTIAARLPRILERIAAGQQVVYASDAGMPSISDPGQLLINAAREAGVLVDVIPGPSACITALVASGLATDAFLFAGFFPRKHGDQLKRLHELAGVPATLLFYESPHRIATSLKTLAEVLPTRMCAVCRELTKLHEEIVRGSAAELAEQFLARPELKGEIVLVIAPPAAGETEIKGSNLAAAHTERLEADIDAALAAGESPTHAAKRLAQQYSVRKREVYEQLLARQEKLGN
ncbi:16S rRNA (cytidine(1402)-2'-O)-methyltransferase [Collinsella sp. zg1085]|uniref:16S rRNA (cytidine(1402)-2'-O)-methyltransferase n=1 Tax=Collinsella sp. zg1085 TaxID=2844380 RepID=UPI001C0E162B|nr:16S rRNA (cytidine(1402)-2'-O)-methyltransferase [Collinsella sp. zg1085]QWT17455.1 16S rRNA (cytidine(1402)-2'-O)-methyltransferase [Collinsella sp. zg1085]